jgi:3-hydroxyacyl-[acyl-carrier protein] dehydratase/trans-2-decenoyl-[acyl-carrier protein] isomerase
MMRATVSMLCCATTTAYMTMPSARVVARAQNPAHTRAGAFRMEVAEQKGVVTPASTKFPPSFDKEGLLAIARGEVFGKENARLPLPPMLMMDRILDTSSDGGLYGKGHVVAEFDINPDLWFFPCHFDGNPIMPGCLGLDALWQLTGYNLAWRGWQGKGYALGVGEVKFTNMVRPTAKVLRYEVDFTKTVQSRRLTMGVADGKMFIDGELAYETKNMKVAFSDQ